MPQKIASYRQYKQQLDHLFNYIENIQTLKLGELEAQWALYLCIRVSGLLETSVRDIFIHYCEGKAHPHIIRYVNTIINNSRSQNMKAEVIIKLAGSFSDQWRKDLQEFLENEGRKEAVDSVINIRNTASHGGKATITYRVIKGYYASIWEVIEFIENQCR